MDSVSLTSPVTPLQTLDYATSTGVNIGASAPLMKQLLTLSVLSGLCVGSCFLVLAADSFGMVRVVVIFAHLLLYAFTLRLAVVAGIRAARADGGLAPSNTRLVLDTIAGFGLLVIGLAPLFITTDDSDTEWKLGVGGLAFACLAGTCWRHVLLYRVLAGLMRSANRPTLARLLNILGVFKFIYESLWLGCCTVGLLGAALELTGLFFSFIDDIGIALALAALFGCIGFAGVWIAMIVLHALCWRVAKGDRARSLFMQ